MWRYLDERGEVAGQSETFEERELAEEWLGSAWQRLLDRGVQDVVLVEGTEVVYQMPLGEGESDAEDG